MYYHPEDIITNTANTYCIIVIYPVDSAVQPLTNWGLEDTIGPRRMWVLHRKYNGCFTFHGQKNGYFTFQWCNLKVLVVPCSTKIYLRYFVIISLDFCPCKIKKNCIINKTKHGDFTGNKRGYPLFMKIPLTAL